MRKTTALVAGGIGYVLGARAGRERYEQIMGLAQRVTSNPKVQQTARQAAGAAKDAAKDAAPVVKDKLTGGSDSSSTGNGVPLEDSAYPQG